MRSQQNNGWRFLAENNERFRTRKFIEKLGDNLGEFAKVFTKVRERGVNEIASI